MRLLTAGEIADRHNRSDGDANRSNGPADRTPQALAK